MATTASCLPVPLVTTRGRSALVTAAASSFPGTAPALSQPPCAPVVPAWTLLPTASSLSPPRAALECGFLGARLSPPPDALAP